MVLKRSPDMLLMRIAGPTSSTTYVATFINCVVGLLYALPWVKPNNSLLVITVNASGVAIELVYIVFFVFANEKKQRIRIILVVVIDIIFMVILSSITFTILHTPAKRTEVVGIICIIFNIYMYASPLSIVATYREDIIRFRISLSSGIAELREEVARRLKLDVGTFDIKYLDDDYEWVLIACDADLQECMDVSSSSGRNIIRPSVHDVNANLGSSCESTGEL